MKHIREWKNRWGHTLSDAARRQLEEAIRRSERKEDPMERIYRIREEEEAYGGIT